MQNKNNDNYKLAESVLEWWEGIKGYYSVDTKVPEFIVMAKEMKAAGVFTFFEGGKGEEDHVNEPAPVDTMALESFEMRIRELEGNVNWLKRTLSAEMNRTKNIGKTVMWVYDDFDLDGIQVSGRPIGIDNALKLLMDKQGLKFAIVDYKIEIDGHGNETKIPVFGVFDYSDVYRIKKGKEN